MKKIILFLTVLSLLFISCQVPQRTAQKQRVHTYKVEQSDNTWLYYYVLFTNNGGYYYYSSSVPVTTFTGVEFVPAQSTDFLPTGATEVQSEFVSPSELPESVSQDVNVESIEIDHDSPESVGGESDGSVPDAGESSSGDSGGGDGGGSSD